MIYQAIQNRAEASLVDHRFILATILQEVCPTNSNTLKSFANMPTPDPRMRQSQGDRVLRWRRQPRPHAIARRHRV